MYKIKRFSVRPYARKIISDSRSSLMSGKNKWDIARELNDAKIKYEKSSSRITSLNPIKLIRNSKDASDSSREISKEIRRVLSK